MAEAVQTVFELPPAEPAPERQQQPGTRTPLTMLRQVVELHAVGLQQVGQLQEPSSQGHRRPSDESLDQQQMLERWSLLALFLEGQLWPQLVPRSASASRPPVLLV